MFFPSLTLIFQIEIPMFNILYYFSYFSSLLFGCKSQTLGCSWGTENQIPCCFAGWNPNEKTRNQIEAFRRAGNYHGSRKGNFGIPEATTYSCKFNVYQHSSLKISMACMLKKVQYTLKGFWWLYVLLLAYLIINSLTTSIATSYVKMWKSIDSQTTLLDR